MSIRIGNESLSKEQRLRLLDSDDEADLKLYYEKMMEEAREAVDDSRERARRRRHVGFQAPRKKK